MDSYKNKNIPAKTRLRRLAEKQLESKAIGAKSGTGNDTQRVLQELEIHQIELELQNEELRQAMENAEHSLEKYTDLYEFAPVGFFTLNRSGIITSVNLRGASLVGIARTRLLGQRFGQLVADEYQHLFNDFFSRVFTSRDKTTCEVGLRKKEKPFFAQLEVMVSISGEECGLVLLDITERKQAEDALRNYASRLIVMEEELRNKLATELHDEICRDMTVLGMNAAIISDGIKAIAPKKLVARAKATGRLIKGISHTIRNIMVGLRPPILDDYGLLAALHWHADLFSKRNGISISFEVTEPFPRLATEQEIALFRITQEALMNIFKHAAATSVTITLGKANGMICFTVADNGKGFLPAAPQLSPGNLGWGMRIMRERAELLGGKFHISSTPGKGATVSVVLHFEESP